MSTHVPQNFYRQIIAQDWSTGTGNFYVSIKPTVSTGYMTISPASSTLREIVFFTGTGTDGTGDYITISTGGRGKGGTTEQTHVIGEPVRMNVSAETIQEIVDDIAAVVAGGAVDASTGAKGISKLSVAPVSSSNPIAVGDNDTRLGGITGMVVPYAGSSAPNNWLLCNGAAVSRSTYSALFAITSTTYGVGDGSTTFNIPDMRGRFPIGVGTGTKVATFASRASNVITVTGLTNASNNEFQTGQAVVYHYQTTAITGLVQDITYYVVRVTNTTFSLASSLANAQNGTVISLSSDGSGTQTFTLTLTARTGGDTGGEENHAMSNAELLSHNHLLKRVNGSGGSNVGISGDTGGGGSSGDLNTANMYSTGGNASMNNMQPFISLNYIIKT